MTHIVHDIHLDWERLLETPRRENHTVHNIRIAAGLLIMVPLVTSPAVGAVSRRMIIFSSTVRAIQGMLPGRELVVAISELNLREG